MTLFDIKRLGPGTARDARPTVLVVDDEDGNLRVLRFVLAEHYHVLEAHDGQEALELIEGLPAEQRPAVVLSDQRMPRMTGVELFERLRETLPDAIRIIITGHVDVAAVVDAINRAGIHKFIVKPLDRDQLLLTVERAVETWTLRCRLDAHVRELEAVVAERTRELEEKNRALQQACSELERASLRDPLTGLGNRSMLDRALRGDVERRRDGQLRGAFLLVDIDHFKAINDQHGHAAGDAVLSALGRILLAQCRDGDIAVRWGGDEFLLYLRVDDAAHALACAARLRQTVASTPLVLQGRRGLQPTCSIGIACLPFAATEPQPVDWQCALSVADAALYEAKRGGRNASVCLAANEALPADFQTRVARAPLELVTDGILHLLREPA
jgi:diguanylate cyclase (GGDEF)-like protein